MQEAIRHFVNRPLEHIPVVLVSQGIAEIQQVHPKLAVGDDLGRESLLDDALGRFLRQDNAAEFQVVLHRLPRQLHSELEALNRAFFFRIGKAVNVVECFAQQPQGFFVILKPLLPSDVWMHAHKDNGCSENGYGKINRRLCRRQFSSRNRPVVFPVRRCGRRVWPVACGVDPGLCPKSLASRVYARLHRRGEDEKLGTT